MDDRCYDKLISFTGGSYDFETSARAMVGLDRPDGRIGVQRLGGWQAGRVFDGDDDDLDATAPPPAIDIALGLAGDPDSVFMAQDENEGCDDG